MKKKFILISVCLVGAVTVLYGGIKLSFNKELEDLRNTELSLPEGFTYTAHTGCMGTTDNSLESIESGVLNGAQIVEFDLNFTDKGEAVLCHNEPRGGEITLDEAFEKVSGYPGLKVNVDAKSWGNLEEVTKLAEKHGVKENIFFTGIRLENVEAVKKACPEVQYYLNCDVVKKKKQTPEYLEELVKTVKDSGAVGINFNKDNATKELVDSFHKAGLLVSIWTVNNEKEMYEILLLSPDNVTTKKPDVMKRILSE